MLCFSVVLKLLFSLVVSIKYVLFSVVVVSIKYVLVSVVGGSVTSVLFFCCGLPSTLFSPVVVLYLFCSPLWFSISPVLFCCFLSILFSLVVVSISSVFPCFFLCVFLLALFSYRGVPSVLFCEISYFL